LICKSTSEKNFSSWPNVELTSSFRAKRSILSPSSPHNRILNSICMPFESMNIISSILCGLPFKFIIFLLSRLNIKGAKLLRICRDLFYLFSLSLTLFHHCCLVDWLRGIYRKKAKLTILVVCTWMHVRMWRGYKREGNLGRINHRDRENVRQITCEKRSSSLIYASIVRCV
jgi:hypothetical protein